MLKRIFQKTEINLLNESSPNNTYLKLNEYVRDPLNYMENRHKHNSIGDLMKFSSSSKLFSKKLFLNYSLKRLENGCNVFILVDYNRLVACILYIPKGTKIFHNNFDHSPYHVFFPLFIDIVEGSFSMDSFITFVLDSCLKFKIEYSGFIACNSQIKNDGFNGYLVDKYNLRYLKLY